MSATMRTTTGGCGIVRGWFGIGFVAGPRRIRLGALTTALVDLDFFSSAFAYAEYVESHN